MIFAGMYQTRNREKGYNTATTMDKVEQNAKSTAQEQARTIQEFGADWNKPESNANDVSSPSPMSRHLHDEKLHIYSRPEAKSLCTSMEWTGTDRLEQTKSRIR